MAPAVRDILSFHRIDRAAYERLVSLGADRRLARDAVALLMWLDRVGITIDPVARVRSLVRTPGAAAQLVSEAHAVLQGPWRDAETPFISSMCGEAVNLRLRFFVFNRDVVRRGVEEVLDGVGAVVFDDVLHALLRRCDGTAGVLPSELAGSYGHGGAAFSMTLAAPVERRSLFITFSKGFPLTREEIDEYFTQRWGDCVERVMMERTAPGGTPKYGRIVFRREAAAAAVLNGQHLVKLLVNGRQLWARKYVPRAHR